MKPIKIEERKILQVEILDAIHEFCISNGIVYSLGYGTLLGAVRHKGFIPWDDDIDIIMLRDDYIRFEELFPDTLNNKYSFGTISRTKEWSLPFGKVYNTHTVVVEHKANVYPIGVSIDVFPLDVVPDNDFKFSLYRAYLKFLCYCSRIKVFRNTSNTSIPKRVIASLTKLSLSIVSNKTLIRHIDSISKKISHCGGKRVYYMPSSGHCDPIPASWFSPIILTEFEGKEYCSVNNQDGYLQAMYGINYMEPPARENRVSFHTNEAYWKEVY